MMKKKVKKIPKYNTGTISANVLDNAMAGRFQTPSASSLGTNLDMASMYSHKNAIGNTTVSELKSGSFPSGIATASNKMLMDTLGIEDNSREGVTLNAAAQGSDIGGSIMPGWGHLIGGIAGGLVGSLKKGSVDVNTGEITSGGIFGRSMHSLKEELNMIRNNIRAKSMTQGVLADYYNNPNVPIEVKVAEGGIMRKPVDALVSKGELIYNPMTKKLSKVPGSKGKPNKKDDVYARLYEGDVVISNSPTMLMSNGKTPAQNLMGMVDKYSTGGTVKAREAIIKKVVNWQEANKTKSQEYTKFDGGGIAKYRYNKNLSDFAYWDKDKNEYKREYLDWVNNLTEQDVKDIFNNKYGDMSTYKSVNKNYIPTVDEARKLMTDKKYGDWHKIGQAIVDNKIKTSVPPTVIDSYLLPIKGGTISEKEFNFTDSGKPLITHRIPYIDKNLKKLANPSEADGIVAAHKVQNKGKGTPDWLSNIADFAPIAAALFGDYDYHTELAQISPAKYIPTGVNIDPIRRAANESYAMARYNQANISPNTGAGMAYGLQAASNRTKSLMDAYTWQQDAQNKLIAQNTGIYNDWAKRYDAARYQAIADTRANEAAAQQMRDSAIRDAYEFTTGRRNDRWKLSMLEPMFKYAVDDNIWKNFRV